MDPRARTLIDRLGLEPHREGGYYREIYRSATEIQPADTRPRRSALTTIYYLLTSGQFSRWHRVRSDEIWHFYDGDPLELFVAPPSLGHVDRVVLGRADSYEQRVYAVPADWWQAARPLGAFTLAGCTVAPGFEFADFSTIPDDPAAQHAIGQLDASLRALA